MVLSYWILFVALALSAVAAWYSIIGLAAIFSAAVIPIIIMGGILEVAKVSVTIWLHEYWHRCRWLMKVYLVPAVGMLMLITSMGIFGFLSKAHSDQSLVSGDVIAKIAVYDEKIKTEKDNIDANRKAIKQLDEAVDQVMGRSSDEKGADKAVQIRRSQQKERARLLAEITESQKRITAYNEERAPIAAEVRKVEAEVGPIKYIAALVYGDNPDSNLLERAVRWVIIILVVVFDPLAIMMVLAATESIKWEREKRREQQETSEPVLASEPEETPAEEEPAVPDVWVNNTNLWPFPTPVEQPEPEHLVVTNSNPEDNVPIEADQPGETVWVDPPLDWGTTPILDVERPGDYVTPPEEDDEKAAMRAWKVSNPDDTIKRQRALYDSGKINHLPWEDAAQAIGLEADNETPQGRMRGFGTAWPDAPVKGDTFLRVDRLPSALYKYNGNTWIEIDKNLSDQYSYDRAYIDHLIAKIDSGEYDPDLLTEAEIEQIQQRFRERDGS